MADEAKADEVIVGTKADETNVPVIDYKAEFEKLQKDNEDKLSVIDKYKKDIAGLDRKVGELTAKEKELLLKTETELETAERLAKEKQDAWETKQNELATKEMELRNQENSLNVKLKATELGISLNEVGKLKLTSIEQLEAYKELRDNLISESTASTTERINKEISGQKLDSYNTNTKVNILPKALEKAFR